MIEWASSNGSYYLCEYTENLLDDPIVWYSLSTGWVQAAGAFMGETDTNAWSRMQRFYRLRVKP